MHKSHKEISDENKQSNIKPTLRADSRNKFKTFLVGDYVMVRIYSKQFCSGLLKCCMPAVLGPLRSRWIAIYICYRFSYRLWH